VDKIHFANRNFLSWPALKSLNRWYTTAPWRLKAGQRHHTTSSAVTTFQFAGRSKNNSDRPCQFFPADACVHPVILILSFTPYPLRTFSHKKILAPNKSRFLILTTLSFPRHERAPCFKNTKTTCAPRVSASFQYNHSNFTNCKCITLQLSQLRWNKFS